MLVVSKLGFSFKHKALFENLDFTLKSGQIFHLVGPNGAGKSTCFSVINGLREPTTGSVSYRQDDQEVADHRFYIEYLSAEANGLYLKMDATDNLDFWAKLRGHQLSRDKIHQELTKWGLGHRLVREKFSVEKFSTGMRRRLALARVNLSKTPLWLLDEPIYGLDHKGIDLFREMVKDHKEAGGMALIISHDTAPLEGLTDATLTLAPAKG